MSAQTPNAFLEKGDEAAALRNWELAHDFYTQAHELDSTIFLAIVKKAEAARMIKRYHESLELYQKAYAKDEGKLIPDELFWIGSLQKTLGQYEDALVSFKKYVKKNTKNKKSEIYQKAMREIEACTWVLSYKEKKQDITFTRLTYTGSEEQSENFNGVENEKLYYSYFNHSSDMWQLVAGEIEDSLIQNRTTISPSNDMSYANIHKGVDGIYYCSICDSLGCDIFSSEKIDMSDAIRLTAIGCDNCSNTMPQTAMIDGSTYLFFASDRGYGEGGMDIWYSKSSNGTFINPENAGPIINTPGDEVTPMYLNEVLYFSSDWHKGFGGFDIQSIAGKPGNWSIPENMGKPYNSSYNDVYFRIINDSLSFFSSNRPIQKESDVCCNDVFEVKKKSKNPDSKTEIAITSLQELNDVLPVTLYFHNDEPNPRTLDTTTTLTYYEAYASYLNRLEEYKREVVKGYTGEQAEDQVQELEDFFELKVKKGYSDLRLFKQLLLAELEKGKSIAIQVRGFASPRAKSDYNKRLTQRRIASLVNDMRLSSDSLFVPYLNGSASNGALLTFEALPFGEDQSATSVSDDLNDTKASIYSRGARLERKIEIQTAILEKHLEGESNLHIEEEYFNFGKIGKYGTVHHEFVLENKGSTDMVIDSLVASCGCTEPKMDSMIISPNSSAIMDVGFSPFGGKGREIKFVTIYLAGEKPRVITIEAEID